MIKDMGEVFLPLQMDHNMKVNTKIIKDMGKALLPPQMVLNV